MIYCIILQAKNEKIEQLEIDLNISEKVKLDFSIVFFLTYIIFYQYFSTDIADVAASWKIS